MNTQRLAAIPIRMKQYVDANQMAGAVTIVARRGKVASFEATGYQDLESKKPMRKNSMFRIASLTKPITCAGIMALVDEGRISVIDPIEKFLPEYKGIKVNGCAGRSAYGCAGVTPSRAINIEDLMMHTSGLEGNAVPAAEQSRRHSRSWLRSARRHNCSSTLERIGTTAMWDTTFSGGLSRSSRNSPTTHFSSSVFLCRSV